MIAHVVMFRPPASISPADREALVEAMRHAVSNIPSIKHVRVGRRRLLGHAYEALMTEHMEYLAVIEFETEADLKAYLEHPAHVELGLRFFQSAEAALVYDFVMVEPGRVRDLLED
jgi:hypothetical protein